ncbi:MAG: DUF2585 family protein [Sphingomicrobium sp.]
MTSARRTYALAATLVLAAVAILFLMGRNLLCTCGRTDLWGAAGPEQSQMFADWYSFSHIVHGFLFYAALAWIVPRWTVERRFAVAIAIEAAWEIIENTPMVIDRYREATAALGYQGDSILNSLSDIAMMAVGFLVARRLPAWASVATVLLLELVPLIVIRDNLTLNVWMLLWPTDWLREWQSAA